MSGAPLLFRVLLSATLILNGASGWAMPAGHPVERAANAIDAQDPPRHATIDAASQLPCHAEEDLPAPDALVESPGTSSSPTGADANGSADDCCASGVCECGCPHQSGFAFIALLLRLPDTHDPQSPIAFAQAHAAPMLPHLIRPPIG